MQEQINLDELEKAVLNLEELTEKVNYTLNHANKVVEENINSGRGVWDGQMAEFYKRRWETLQKEFPSILETFSDQEKNLKEYLENMKRVESV